MFEVVTTFCPQHGPAQQPFSSHVGTAPSPACEQQRTAKRLRQMFRWCGAASMLLYLSAATRLLHPSHLYLRGGDEASEWRHSVSACQPPAPAACLLQLPASHPAIQPPLQREAHLLSPSRRSVALNAFRAASRLAMRADTSSVSPVQLS